MIEGKNGAEWSSDPCRPNGERENQVAGRLHDAERYRPTFV